MLEVAQDYKDNIKLPAVSRVLLSMSLGDVLSSLVWFLGSWIMPADDKEYPHSFGTKKTCQLEGFLFQLGSLSSLFFNASLAAIYLLMIRYKWKKENLILFANPLICVIWTLTFAAALILLLMDMYCPNGPICWINNSSLLLGMIFLPILLSILLASFVMVVIYWEFQTLERPAGRERRSTSTSAVSPPREQELDRQSDATDEDHAVVAQLQKQSQSQIMARQGIWYLLGFLLTYGPTLASAIFFACTGGWNGKLDRTSYFFLALQGFWNCLIFTRGRRDMKSVVGRVIRRLIWDTDWSFMCPFCRIQEQFTPPKEPARPDDLLPDDGNAESLNQKIESDRLGPTPQPRSDLEESEEPAASFGVEEVGKIPSHSPKIQQSNEEATCPTKTREVTSQRQIFEKKAHQQNGRHRWIGRFIDLADFSKRRQGDVSELGTSKTSVADEESHVVGRHPGTSFVQKYPPLKPIRKQSEASPSEADITLIDSEKKGLQYSGITTPTTRRTFMDDSMKDGTLLLSSPAASGCNSRRQRGSATPPRKPIRVTSEAESNTLQSPQSTLLTSKNNPPKIPIRVDSEVESNIYSQQASKTTAPRIPVRVASEAESNLQPPPAKLANRTTAPKIPVRVASETETHVEP